jgi:hypothetical protein
MALFARTVKNLCSGVGAGDLPFWHAPNAKHTQAKANAGHTGFGHPGA